MNVQRNSYLHNENIKCRGGKSEGQNKKYIYMDITVAL